MEGDAGIGGDFHPYDVKITLPEERLYGPSLLDRLEDVEVTLGHLASPTADDSYVRPRALDLPWRELRRIRLALAKLLNCDEDD